MNPQSQDVSQPILQTQGLTKSFLGLQALQDFSIVVNVKEILGLIGPNGAGKTTCFNLLTGFLDPSDGRVFFKQRDITGLPPAQIARLGIELAVTAKARPPAQQAQRQHFAHA